MDSNSLYRLIEPEVEPLPIVLSVPHAGTFIPDEIKKKMVPEMAETLEDTDWFVDLLYDFAPSLGIPMIVANFSRWVIDLNRNPGNQPLYSDGRVITDVITLTDFNGKSIYQNGYAPDEVETERRTEHYFKPYHQKVGELLQETKAKFGTALLFDAHSIKKNVPGIRNEDFPELILGDNDETSAHPELIKTAIFSLENKGFGFSHNFPFKGGSITRSFGKPQENIHALQLEMVKTNYMDDFETNYHPERAEKIRTILKETLVNLSETLLKLKF